MNIRQNLETIIDLIDRNPSLAEVKPVLANTKEPKTPVPYEKQLGKLITAAISYVKAADSYLEVAKKIKATDDTIALLARLPDEVIRIKVSQMDEVFFREICARLKVTKGRAAKTKKRTERQATEDNLLKALSIIHKQTL